MTSHENCYYLLKRHLKYFCSRCPSYVKEISSALPCVNQNLPMLFSFCLKNFKAAVILATSYFCFCGSEKKCHALLFFKCILLVLWTYKYVRTNLLCLCVEMMMPFQHPLDFISHAEKSVVVSSLLHPVITFSTNLIFNFKNVIYKYVCASVSICRVHSAYGGQRGIRPLWARVTGSCDLSDLAAGVSGPPQDLQALFTVEPFL